MLLNITRKPLRCFCIFGWQKIFSAILSPYSQEQMPETECPLTEFEAFLSKEEIDWISSPLRKSEKIWCPFNDLFHASFTWKLNNTACLHGTGIVAVVSIFMACFSFKMKNWMQFNEAEKSKFFQYEASPLIFAKHWLFFPSGFSGAEINLASSVLFLVALHYWHNRTLGIGDLLVPFAWLLPGAMAMEAESAFTRESTKSLHCKEPWATASTAKINPRLC